MFSGEKELPLITVMVPVYNGEKYLERCIDSIQNQSYEKIEIILIDDGSTDKSGSICDRYADGDWRIKVIHQNNIGLASTRNRALEEATGEYLMFVDADDFIHPNMLEILYKDIENNNAQMAIGSYIEGSGEEFPEIAEDVKVSVLTDSEKFKGLFGDQKLQFIVSWGRLYSRALFEDIKYPDGRIHEDEYLAHYLLYRAEKITVNDSKLYYYYKEDGGNESITQSGFSLKRLDCINALEDRLSFFKDYGDAELIALMYDDFLKRFQYYYYGVHYQFPDEADLARNLFDEYKNVYEEGKTMLSAGKRLRYSLFIILPTLNYYLKMIMNSKSIKT